MTKCKDNDGDLWHPCQECEENLDGMMDDMVYATATQAIAMTVEIAKTFDRHEPSLLMRFADIFTTQALFTYAVTGKKKHYEEVLQMHTVNVLDRVERLQAKAEQLQAKVEEDRDNVTKQKRKDEDAKKPTQTSH